MKMTYLSPLLPFYSDDLKKIYGPNGSATTGYICHAIGADRQEGFFRRLARYSRAYFLC